jgi:hypothetical protein
VEEDGARSAPTAGTALFRSESRGWASLKTGAASSALTRVVSGEEGAAAEDVHRGRRGRRAPVSEVSCPGRKTAVFVCQAPCARIEKHHTDLIYYGNRGGRSTGPRGPGAFPLAWYLGVWRGLCGGLYVYEGLEVLSSAKEDRLALMRLYSAHLVGENIRRYQTPLTRLEMPSVCVGQ